MDVIDVVVLRMVLSSSSDTNGERYNLAVREVGSGDISTIKPWCAQHAREVRVLPWVGAEGCAAFVARFVDATTNTNTHTQTHQPAQREVV